MLCLNSFPLMGQSQKTVFACFVTPRENSFSKCFSKGMGEKLHSTLLVFKTSVFEAFSQL